jgi:carboxymethylenebutenolidase
MSQSGNGGFSPATPVTEQTVIHTGSEGLREGDIVIPAGSDRIPGYFAAPAAGDGHPVVLVVHEIFGVHEHIRDVVRRLAHAGYMAVAPELFVRQGDVSALTSFDAIRPIVAQVPDAQVLADLDAAADWAAAAGGDTGRLGITGFCWGGRITWLYAAHQPRLRAAVAWYGRLQGEPTALQPRHPLDVAATLRAPVLGLYGGEDASIPLQSIREFRTHLRAVHPASVVHVYEQAPHAFFADYRPGYRRDAAADGWQRLLAWFRQHGV